MKSIKNFKLLMIVGLLLPVGVYFVDARSGWEPSGPTAEDIKAATKVDTLAAKGSREESLINAVKIGDHKKVASLIAEGVSLDARDNGDRTALMRAAEKGDVDSVKMLLDAGANVSTQDKFRWTALFMAVDKNNVEVVKILIAQGAALDKNFEDMFVSSVFKGNVEMVKALAGDGVHINCDIINAATSVINYRNAEMVKLINHLKSQCKND